MVDDPRFATARITSTTSLSDYELGISFCTVCKNPVYDRARYRGNCKLRAEAKRGRVTLASTMHVVEGPDGQRDVCGACVKRLRIRKGDDEE